MTDRELMQKALASLEGYARNCRCEGRGGLCDAGKALRARLAQPEPEWQGLTDEEIKSAASLGIYEKPLIDFARAIEAKLKEKNT